MIDWKRLICFFIIGGTIGFIGSSIIELIIATFIIVSIINYIEYLAVKEYKKNNNKLVNRILDKSY